MHNSGFRVFLSKASSVMSLVFMVGVTSSLIGGFAGSIISTALGFFNSDAIFWEFGFLEMTALCALLIACTTTILILRGLRSRMGLNRFGGSREFAVCAFVLLVALALAFVPNFSASSQAYFFVKLGIRTLTICLCTIAVVLVWRGDLEINLANASMEAHEGGVSGEFVEMQGGSLPEEEKNPVPGQLLRLLILIPICLWMLHFMFAIQPKATLPQADAPLAALDKSCERYGSACALRSTFLYLEDAHSFEEARKRVQQALVVLPRVDIACPDARAYVGAATMLLSGAPMAPDSLPAGTYRGAEIMAGGKMQTDIHVFYVRYRMAIKHYNSAVAAQIGCNSELGPDFESAMLI